MLERSFSEQDKCGLLRVFKRWCAQAACSGGGGGFYSNGTADATYSAPGGTGFRQGGSASVFSAYTGYDIGGFGGGAPADYVGSCNSQGGAAGGYTGASGRDGAAVAWGYGGGSIMVGGVNTIAQTGGAAAGSGSVLITAVATNAPSTEPSQEPSQRPTLEPSTAVPSFSPTLSGVTYSPSSAPTTAIPTSSSPSSSAPTAAPTYPGPASFSYSGVIQYYQVPATGIYRIRAQGAQGGSAGACPACGGLGALMQGDFILNGGQWLAILVKKNVFFV